MKIVVFGRYPPLDFSSAFYDKASALAIIAVDRVFVQHASILQILLDLFDSLFLPDYLHVRSEDFGQWIRMNGWLI